MLLHRLGITHLSRHDCCQSRSTNQACFLSPVGCSAHLRKSPAVSLTLLNFTIRRMNWRPSARSRSQPCPSLMRMIHLHQLQAHCQRTLEMFQTASLPTASGSTWAFLMSFSITRGWLLLRLETWGLLQASSWQPSRADSSLCQLPSTHKFSAIKWNC